MPWMGTLAMLALAARADCDDPAVLVSQAERDLGYLDVRMAVHELDAAVTGWGCWGLADRRTLARAFLAYGVAEVLSLGNASPHARDRLWAASKRVWSDDDLWLPEYPGDIRAEWLALPAQRGDATIVVAGEVEIVALDGAIVSGPGAYEVAAGLHLVQAGTYDRVAFSKLVDVPAGVTEPVIVSDDRPYDPADAGPGWGLPPRAPIVLAPVEVVMPEPVGRDAGRARRPVGLAVGAVAGLGAGTVLYGASWVSRSQYDQAADAQQYERLNRLRARTNAQVAASTVVGAVGLGFGATWVGWPRSGR